MSPPTPPPSSSSTTPKLFLKFKRYFSTAYTETIEAHKSHALFNTYQHGLRQFQETLFSREALVGSAIGSGIGALTFIAGKYAWQAICVGTLRLSNAHGFKNLFSTTIGVGVIATIGTASAHAAAFSSSFVATRGDRKLAAQGTYPYDWRAYYTYWQHLKASYGLINRDSLGNFDRRYEDRVVRDLNVQSVAFCTLSLLCYRLLGGRFSYVFPADLWRVGPFKRHTLPASKGATYADADQKFVLQTYGRQYGCHHCGIRYGRLLHYLVDRRWMGGFIGDHIPPNKYASSVGLGERRRVFKQEFLPQCTTCSGKQSNSVRTDSRQLVFARSLRLYDLFLPIHLLSLLIIPTLLYIDDRTVQKLDDEDKLQSAQAALRAISDSVSSWFGGWSSDNDNRSERRR